MFNLIRFIWNHPLNRTNRWSAISRMARWQMATRLLPEALLGMPFIDDTKLFMKRGMTGATGNWYAGLHECDDMGFVLHLLRPDSLFVDVGANIGSYSILAAATESIVISVEPIPDTFEHLKNNIRLNSFDAKIEAHCVGLSNKKGSLKFSSKLDTVNHVVADDEDIESVVVPVTTLDLLLDGRCPDLLKIDVEGHEREVLLGALSTLNNPALLAVLMETNGSGKRYGIEDDELIELMKEHGFESFSYNVMERKLRPSLGSDNTIFVRDVVAVQKRLSSAGETKLVNRSI